MSEMFDERQRAFLARPRIGRLATVGRDGTPHVSPVWYRFEDGVFLVLTERGSQKHRNIERDPRVEFCVDDERPPYHTVILRARVEVEEAPGAEWREQLAIHYLGEEAGRRYVAQNRHPNNIMLRILPVRVRGW
jgi:PPOX class probable F420-dependent enzyme